LGQIATVAPTAFTIKLTQLGLTNAIRYVRQHAGKPMTPVDVRDELLKRYCDPEDYRNLLRAHVMKRLERTEITLDGTRAEWTGALPKLSSVLSPPEHTFARNDLTATEALLSPFFCTPDS